ncbi:MAG: TrkH family potassium uptake protein [Planctomycetota bacterium]
MNLGQVARLLAGFALFFSASLLVPMAVALGEETELATKRSFAISLGVGLASAIGLWLLGRGSSRDIFRKEGLAVVGLAWLVAGGLGALPFVCSGAIPSAVDGFFESISGLTTTGATVLGTNNLAIDSLPTSILLWRAMMQWMGGMGIILVFIVLLPGMGVTGSRLLSSEQVGVASGMDQPRMQEQARRLFGLYIVLTLLAGLGYSLVGLGPFDAVCHAFTTVATGGFSNHNVSIGGYQNLGVELVAIAFMFLAGCNFLLLVRVAIGRRRTQRSSLLHDTEFRVYLGLTLVIAAAMTLSLWFAGGSVRDDSLGITRDYDHLGHCARDALFQTVSILTSTGYCTADFQNWPKTAIGLLVLCMFVGGCTGSTSGGFKVLRLVVCSKLVGYALRHFVKPRSVEKLKIGPDVIPDRIVSAILALLLLWLATVAAGTFILSFDARLDLVSAFTVSVSMMGCTGPAISGVVEAAAGEYELVGGLNIGPYGGYGALHPAAKLFMSLQMILGRLEILAPLALLTPAFWRR